MRLDEGEVLVLLELFVLAVAALGRLGTRRRPLCVGAGGGHGRAQPLLLTAVAQVLSQTERRVGTV